MSSPPIVITFSKIARMRRKFITHYKKGDDDFKTGSTENALPELPKSMDALLPVFVRHAGCVPSYSENARISEVHFAEHGGATTVRGVILKHLEEASGAVKIVTPWRYLSMPEKQGTAVSMVIPKAEIHLVQEFQDHARDYVIGKRAQGVLPGIGLVEDEESGGGEGEGEDEAQGKLPVGEPGSEDGPPSDGKKKRGSKKKGGKVEKFPGHGSDTP